MANNRNGTAMEPQSKRCQTALDPHQNRTGSALELKYENAHELKLKMANNRNETVMKP